ncbi:MAG: SRPBCC family protein [Nitrospira sp.]|nr:SRPBCC family protein [Nitrospira sp.]MCP9442216.1 SRPBCC family protein [Nitrospira sp.]
MAGWKERFKKQFMERRRSPAQQARRGLWLLVLAAGVLIALRPLDVRASTSSDALEVVQDPMGGVRATARLVLPAKTHVIHDLLTDYNRWPELFDVRMRLAGLTVQDGVATVDLRIMHPLLPGERRLVTESRLLPGGGLVTDLKDGDFKRYRRVWTLHQAGEGNQTQAEFELVFELDSLVPDWIVVVAVRQELEAHFRILKQRALERSRSSSRLLPVE